MWKNKMIIVVLACAVCALLCCCSSPLTIYNHPFVQYGTTWISDNEQITFFVPERDENEELSMGKITGKMVTPDGDIDFCLHGSISTSMIGLTIVKKNGEEEQNSEIWVGRFLHKDKFTVEVVYTTFFEKGQIITFYRVD